MWSGTSVFGRAHRNGGGYSASAQDGEFHSYFNCLKAALEQHTLIAGDSAASN
jgi:hypothetical protein